MVFDSKPEVLAPAGGMKVLEAALASGADAAYLGLKHFNARNGAQNLLPEELADAVVKAHAVGAKIYLTLNTALCQRDLGMAARSLALAAQCQVDGILVEDPFFLLAKPFFPSLSFHFSTQAGVSSASGVRASRELGLTRVVLARELTMDEIRSAAAVDGIETEVFVQGALCFSCSGRCLLSSWGGGRSGNRGGCTSPCRVAWRNEDGVEARPMSMRDLCLKDWVGALSLAGVDSLKIEGRLKSASWVSRAVGLYRKVLDGADCLSAALSSEAASLGDYTGRDVTDGYVRGERSYLTAESGRSASCCTGGGCENAAAPSAGVAIRVSSDEKGGTLWHFELAGKAWDTRTPPQRIANAKRAVAVADLVAEMVEAVRKARKAVETPQMADGIAERLLPRRAGNAAQDALEEFLRSLNREDDGMPRGVELPEGMKALLGRKGAVHPDNRRTLGQRPDRLCVHWQRAGELGAVESGVILDCAPWTLADADAMLAAAAALRCPELVIRLPQVMYDGQEDALKALIEGAVKAGYAVEVNSWDTWKLAKDAGAVMEGGPGLAVLNSLAALELQSLGLRSVTVTPEIDQEQLEDLCASAEVPLSILVYGMPALMTTRAVLPQLFRDGVLTDARGIALKPEHCGQLTILRSVKPMDWRCLRNPRVRAAHLVQDWDALSADVGEKPFLFNYDRRLR